MLLVQLMLLLGLYRIPPGAAGVPYRQPQLAAGQGRVAMTFGAGTAIYYAASPDGGLSFGTPVKVAEVGVLALGRHRGPRLAIAKDALVISAVVGEKKNTGPHAHNAPDDGNLAVWRSTDQGKTWVRTGSINDVPAAAREGLHAMAADAKGNLFATWLDLRSKGTKLYGARSTDGGLTWSRNVEIYSSPGGTICECCDPSVMIDSDGRIWAMWRNFLDGSRDLYTTSSADGIHFETAKKLGSGTWKLNACPMDGGGFAVDHGRVVSAWRREGDVFLAGSNGVEKRVGTGKDVAIAQGRDGSYVAWTKGGGIQLLTPGGAEPVTLAPEGSYVNLVALPDGAVIAAWEGREGIETKRIEAGAR